MAFSADGRTSVRLGGAAGSILAIEARTGRVLAVHQPNASDWMRFDSYALGSSIGSVGTSSFLLWDGKSKRLEILGFDGTSEPGTLTPSFVLDRPSPIEGQVLCSAISPSRDHLAAATRDAVHVVSLRAPDRALVLADPFVQALGYSSDGKRLVTTRWSDGADLFRVWGVPEGKLLGSIALAPRPGYADGVRCVGSVPDSDRMVVSGWKCGVSLIDLRELRVVRDLTSTSTGVTAVAVSPDGAWASLGHLNGDVRIVGIADAKANESPPADLWAKSGVHSGVDALTWGTKPRVVAVAWSGGRSGLLTVTGGSAVVEAEPPSPPGRLTAVGACEGVIVAAGWGPEIWIGADGTEGAVRLPVPASDAVASVACSSGHGRVVLGTRQGRVLYGTARGELQALLSLGEPVSAVSVSTDGQQVFALGTRGGVAAWPARARRPTAPRAEDVELRCSAIGADGLAVACVDTIDPRVLYLYRRTSAEDPNWDEASVTCSHPIHCCSVSPNGKFVAAGDDEYGIVLWEPGSRRPPDRLVGHERRVNSTAFFPDGSVLVSGGDDFALRLWDVASGKALATLSGNWTEVASLAVSGDGRRIVAGGAGGEVCVWRRRR